MIPAEIFLEKDMFKKNKKQVQQRNKRQPQKKQNIRQEQAGPIWQKINESDPTHLAESPNFRWETICFV